MCADKVKNIVTLSSDISAPLIADMQYFELYSTEALNRKMKNIVLPGVYCGFEPVPGDGLFVRITSEKTEGRGAASVDVGKCQISVQQVSDVVVPVEAGVTTIIVLEANYEHGVKTSQVDSSSDISAARIIALVDEGIASNQIELCRVIVPDNAQAVTADMISTKYRANRAVGVEFSSALDSDEEYKAATPLAISTLNKLKAPVDSPEFIGIPTSPTPEQGTNSTQIANAAFVQAAITALIDGSPSALDTLKKIADAINNDPQFSQTINDALALKAPLLSPAFTGVPTAPTASQGTNNTQIATTAYVRAAISALVGSSPEALDTLNELAAALGNDPNFATTMTNALAGKQPLDATLTALAGLATGANKLPYFTGTDTVAQTDLTSVGRDILAKTSTLAVIQYLGLRELGTSGEKLPLLSTANTWSARQTFSAGITGTLTGNADTATKLKTARKINGVAFDGSADITLTPEDLGLTDIASQAGNAVQRSGDTMGGQLKIGTINALRIFNQDFGLIFRRSEESLHLIPTNEGEGENGNIGPLRPFSINLRTGLVSIGNGVKVGGGITGDLTGNADTATKIKTARKIGGVAFDGSADINLPGVNATGNQNTTGNAATATKLQTARTIGGVSFDGSANIDLPGVNKTGNQSTTGNAATATKLQTARTIGGVSFDGSANINLPGVNIAGNQNTTGNAATATKLQTARTIGGVSFDGSANINLPGVNIAGNQNTTGNAATATKLQTARTINGVSFDGSANISLSPANIGCPASPTGWLVTGDNGASITTEQLVTLLRDNGAFNAKAWIARCAWAYANSASIPDSETGCGIIPLAGAVIEVFNNGSSSNNYTIRITTATTTSVSGALTNAEFVYVFNGTSYSPGWRRAYNTKNKPTAADVGALPLSGGALTGGLTAAGEIISKSANGLRIAYGNYGFFIRNDGSNTYFMLTDSGNSLGTYNRLRPLIINNANGAVTIGNGLNVTGGINGSLNGNAATATKLQTARTIGGVSFDGTANINLPGVNIAGNQNTSGNAATATKLKTARKISGVAFDGSADITLTASHVGALPTTGGTVTGEIISSSQNAIRLTYNNNYGFLITNTGYSFQISTTGQNVNGDVVYTPLKIDGGDGRVELGRADGHVRVMGNLSAAGQITPGNYSNFNTKYQAKNTAYANIHGWHKDTSTRVMMQWGFITNLTPGSVVNFPTTFPEACAVVVISPHSGNAVNSILYTYNHSATGFTVKSSSTDKIYAQYVAYGY